MQKRKPKIFYNLSIHIVKCVNMSQVTGLSYKITDFQEFFARLINRTTFISRLAPGRVKLAGSCYHKTDSSKSRVKMKTTHMYLYLISSALFPSNHMWTIILIHSLSIYGALYESPRIQWSLSKRNSQPNTGAHRLARKKWRVKDRK